jgi:protocatechuate 3,4-dioxygenase beta subunit
MENDDEISGRILPRREVLALFGSAGAAALLAACGGESASERPTAVSTQASSGGGGAVATQATGSAAAASTAVPSCVVVPALTEGPYFVDEGLDRSDIRSDPTSGTIKPGTLLNMNFNVSRVSGQSCTVLSNAKVDIWHCDAQGAYSDVSDNMVGSTRGLKFLRGYQMTDSSGKASFTTVYPGWYPGRAVHIHFKIRYENREFTSQLFFDESLSTQLFTQAAYQKSGNRTMNSADSIYRQAGDVLLLQLSPSGDGYSTTFNIGLQA